MTAEREALVKARDALQAMMDTWFDYHDAHSLTRPARSSKRARPSQSTCSTVAVLKNAQQAISCRFAIQTVPKPPT